MNRRLSITAVLVLTAACADPGLRPETGGAASQGIEGAIATLSSYYESIARADYDAAYARWGDEGRSSGQTLEEFRNGFDDTEETSVRAEIGVPGRIDGAVGSRFVSIPVTIRAQMRDGTPQCFDGDYVLRRTVVDGSTPDQRRWHLYSANLRSCELSTPTDESTDDGPTIGTWRRAVA